MLSFLPQFVSPWIACIYTVDVIDDHPAHHLISKLYKNMSFAFGFSGDDIGQSEPIEILQKPKDTAPTDLPPVPPQLHSLAELLATLHNVRLTFDNFTTPDGNIVYRRELFDIKHQVMMEEDAEKASDSQNDIHNILIGDSEVDIRKNVYEGGFKLWECSYDLVDEIARLAALGELSSFQSYLELGCGTALPSCFLLMLCFQNLDVHPTSLVLADFNYEVLRLVTVPNLIVSWASTLDPAELNNLIGPDVTLANDELLLTPDLLAAFEKQTSAKGIDISFISGLWGEDFCNIAGANFPEVILTSETIYSLDSMPVLLNVLLQLVASRPRYLALVAAKHYYFGVGGSIKEFTDRLLAQKPEGMKVDTVGITKGQLKRDIVRLTLDQ